MLQKAPSISHKLALSKFSYATTSYGYNGPIPWTHLMTDTGLFVLFEIFQRYKSSQASSQANSFKIIHDPEVLVSTRDPDWESVNMRRKISTWMPWDQLLSKLKLKPPSPAFYMKLLLSASLFSALASQCDIRLIETR